MNELSWLLYAADVAGEVNFVCGTVFVGGLIGISVYSVGKGIAAMVNSGYNEDPISPSIASVAKKIWIPVVVAAAIGIIAPSQATIYAIAASEMGERVVNSETGDKAVKALNAWLDKQISGGTK